MRILHLHVDDNVVNALSELTIGQEVSVGERVIRVVSRIPMGHKMSIALIRRGAPVVKYGRVIGYAREEIQAGQHVHVHNVRDPVANWKDLYFAGEDGNGRECK